MLGAEYNQQINFPNETCPICEFLIKEVSKWISYNESVESIEKDLDSVCDKIPSVAQKQCYDFVNDNVERLTSAFIISDPESACGLAALCPKKSNKTQSFVCDACFWTLSGIESLLLSNRTSIFLSSLLSTLCPRSVPSLYSLCQSVLSDAISSLLHLLSNQIKKESICALIKKCPSDPANNIVSFTTNNASSAEALGSSLRRFVQDSEMIEYIQKISEETENMNNNNNNNKKSKETDKRNIKKEDINYSLFLKIVNIIKQTLQFASPYSSVNKSKKIKNISQFESLLDISENTVVDNSSLSLSLSNLNSNYSLPHSFQSSFHNIYHNCLFAPPIFRPLCVKNITS